ncbi:PAS domain-containing sensor histidine kinase [Desulfopila aestuarii]|uniref:histidine kinase n=1 Tax=Desulfopila aestuarii DSM 18488 TaxID=1121416 RepID=A0A1M7XZR2_9BACT|nr:ATP-binding protein [Desulfopila aestuarii]SHO44679.1 His Kinase A (phospho-acceptor) domain-containing protein [Desulfopila aestuarii DSM 18488]
MKTDCPLPRDTIGITDSEPLSRNIPANAGIELFYALMDPVLLVTPQGIILEVNSALLKAAGKTRNDVVGRGVCEVIHGGRWPHILCPLEEFLLTSMPRVEDTRLPGLGGNYSLTIAPVPKSKENEEQQILLVARPLTKDEVRKVDSIRTAQLAAIGELAAGVAHEVNNPINGIINFAQLLLDDCKRGTEEAALLEKIVQEGERIASIIYNLLSFARERDNERNLVDLNEVVRECIFLVEHQLNRDGINLVTHYHEPSCLIVGNFSELQQVVINLISNSRYALNERYREPAADKVIEINTEPALIEGRDYYRLTIRDYGTGIPQGILDKMFEPFFTSKPAGKGSGLGLSISYGIISGHKGILRVDSMLNQYTDMIVEIPATEHG